MSGLNTLEIGKWNVICDRCGSKQKSDQVTKTWDGLIVCKPEIKKGCFEHRHPQDFVRSVPDEQKVAFTRPETTDQFVNVTYSSAGTQENSIPLTTFYPPVLDVAFTSGATVFNVGSTTINTTRAGATATRFAPVDKYIDMSFVNQITTPTRPDYTPSTNEFEITAKVRFWSATPDGDEMLDLVFGAGGLASYGITTSSGALRVRWSTTGANFFGSNSSALSLGANTVGYIKAQWRGNDGAGNVNVRFWTSSDGITWTQLGTTTVIPGAVTLKTPGTVAPVMGSGAYYLYWIEVRDKYDGSGNLCLRFASSDGQPQQTTITSSFNSAVWTMPYAAVVGGELTTVAANTPRYDYDRVSLAYNGLLIEEARTNLLLYSEDFANAVWNKFRVVVHSVAHPVPSGAVALSILEEDATAAASHLLSQSITKAASPLTYTISVFARRANTTVSQIGRQWMQLCGSSDGANIGAGCGFDLVNGVIGTPYVQGGFTTPSATITAISDTYYRCTLTFTTDSVAALHAFFMIATGPNLADVFFNGTSQKATQFYGPQLELGACATSYIPTTSATVTRNADVVLPVLDSSWFNVSEGTIIAEAKPSVIGDYGLFSFNDGSSNNRMDMRTNGFSIVSTSGVNQAAIDGRDFTVNSTGKGAFAYKVNNFAQCINGIDVSLDTSGTIPTISQLQFGAIDGSTTNSLNGCLRRFTYYQARLRDGLLQQLSKL